MQCGLEDYFCSGIRKDRDNRRLQWRQVGVVCFSLNPVVGIAIFVQNALL